MTALAIVGLSLATPAGAQETLHLTLDEAVRRAVENNPDLAIVKLGTEVEAARVGETRSAYTPLLSTALGRSSSVTAPSTFLLGDRGVNVDDWFSSTSVRQRLPWGSGTWSVSWDAARTATNNPISSFDPSLQSGVQVAFSQPLLKDRTIDAARQQYIIAKRNQENSDLRFHEAVVQTVAAVKQAYWMLRARTGAEDAEDALRRLIVDPADESFWHVHLDPIEEPAHADRLPDVDAAVANTLKERSDLARAGHELENAATTVKFLDNQRLPDVRLEASYRGSGLGGTQFLRTGDFPGVVTGTLTRGFGNALGQTFSSDYPTWSVGLTVSYPLGRSYEAANLAQARVERQQAAQRIASLRIQAAETVRRAGRQIHSKAERVDAARAGSDLAQQRLEAEQRRYDVGLSTTFLVTQAQRDLLEAQVNLLQTTLDYESALVNFEAVQQAPPLATGDTVGVRGANIIQVPTPTPRGIFRPGAGAGF